MVMFLGYVRISHLDLTLILIQHLAAFGVADLPLTMKIKCQYLLLKRYECGRGMPLPQRKASDEIRRYSRKSSSKREDDEFFVVGRAKRRGKRSLLKGERLSSFLVKYAASFLPQTDSSKVVNCRASLCERHLLCLYCFCLGCLLLGSIDW